MLEIDGISKSFKGRQALHPLHLRVEAGEIFGLLGHNGAGKSTTFGITLGHVKPDSGEVRIAGQSVQHHRAKALHHVGAIFETPTFHDYLSGWRNLEILVAMTAKPDPVKMRAMIDLVGLSGRIHDPVSVYSHGMRQRLALAQALLPSPRLIILDEPSEGLDPEGIQEMRTLILRLRDEHGLTVLLSSHLLSEVEQICSRIAILNQGRLMYCGSWKDSPTTQPRWTLEIDDWTIATPVLETHGCIRTRENEIALPSDGDIADVVAALVHARVRVQRVDPVKSSLESFYLEHIRE